MINANNSTSRQSGAALLAALILIGILGIGIASLYRHLHHGIHDYRRLERDLRVLHLAEAGVDAAIARMRMDVIADQTSFRVQLGGEEIQIAVETEDHPGVYRITSRAELRDGPVVRAADTYIVTVHRRDDGVVTRLTWQRKKRQL